MSRTGFAGWWDEKVAPKLASAVAGAIAALEEWWRDIGENPKAHFISAVFGMLVLVTVKLAVYLAA